MLSRTRLLLLVIFAYAGVLNVFVAHLFLRRHPDIVTGVRRRSLGVVARLLPRHAVPESPVPTVLHGLPHVALGGAGARADGASAAGARADEESAGAAVFREAVSLQCPPGLPAIVVAVAPARSSPDMRMLNAIRDNLQHFPLRVVLLGVKSALSPAHRVWCSGGPIPCALAELAADADAATRLGDMRDPAVLAALAETLLAVTPCLDDVVLLHSALVLPPFFVRQLQRLTRPGKLTCLATRRRAPSVTPFAPCPALAFRLPRAFLLSLRTASGDATALAAERGLLAPAVALLRVS